MKKKLIIPFIILFLPYCCFLYSLSYAAEFILKNKKVLIDNKSKIKATYRYKILLDNQNDIRVFSEILIPTKSSVRNVLGVFAYYYTEFGEIVRGEYYGNSIIFHELKVGSTIEYGFTIETTFYGFEGLFSDRFKASDIFRVRKCQYTVLFPHKTKFRWILDRKQKGEKQKVKESYSKNFEWECSGLDSAKKVAVLKISTFSSWGEVKDHFVKLYREIINAKNRAIALPKVNIKKNSSTDEKIVSVLHYLKNNFRYKTYISPAHMLVPDHPAEVLERGWGDCKDIVLLGVTILNKLGIEAFIVLTGPFNNHNVDLDIPDPYSLNHAIIGISSEKGVRYFDYLGSDYYANTEGKRLIAMRVGCDTNRIFR